MQLYIARKTFLVLITLTIILSAGCKEDTDNDASPLPLILEQAEAYIDQGQFKAAIIEAKNALRLDPLSIDAISLAARINIKLGRPDKALELLNNTKVKNSSQIKLLIAETYLAQGKFRSSLEQLPSPNQQNPALAPHQKISFHQISFKSNLSLNNFSEAATQLKTLKKLSQSKADKAEYNYLNGALLFKQNKLDQADMALESALTENVEHVDALLTKSAIAHIRNNLELSEEHLTSALLALGESDTLLPKKIKTLSALIDVLTTQGRSSEAYIYTKILAQNNPKATEVKSKVTEAIDLYTSGDYEKAESMLLEINKSTPNQKTRQLLGLLSLKKGQISDAENYLSEGFDPEIANSKTISLLARTQLQLKQPEKVVAMLKEEMKSRSNDAEILTLYGLASLATNNEEEGVKSILEALKIAPERHRLNIALADYYTSIDKNQKALMYLEKAYKATPDSAEIQQSLLKLYLGSSVSLEQTEFYKALVNTPNSSRLNFLVGAIQLTKGDKKQATSKLEKAVASDDTNLDALYALALIKLSNKQPKKAETLFLEIIKQTPKVTHAYRGLAQALIQQGKTTKIEKQMLSLIEKNPDSTGPLEVLSELAAKQEDTDKALKYAKQAYNQKPGVTSKNLLLKIYNIRAQKHLAKNNLQLARLEATEALKISPSSLLFLAELINIELKDHKIKDAEELVKQVDKLAPKSALSYSLNSDVASAKGMPDEAAKLLRKSWAIAKTNGVARKYFLILSQSDQLQANAFLDEWALEIPRSAEPLRKKGTILLGENKIDQAVPFFESALKLAPKDVISLNNLAWLYQEKGDERAITISKQAHELAPKSGAVADTYGWILIQNNKKELGIKTLKIALELSPESDEIRKHLESATSGN